MTTFNIEEINFDESYLNNLSINELLLICEKIKVNNKDLIELIKKNKNNISNNKNKEIKQNNEYKKEQEQEQEIMFDNWERFARV